MPITTKADNSFPPNSNYLCPFVVLEKALKSPLDCKEIKPVTHKKKKKNQPSICIGRTDAETETPNILASWCGQLIRKDPDAVKD